MVSYGIARWKQKKWEMDQETKRKSRQRMQKKDNAPCNNQLKRTKRKEDKKKVTFHQENCIPKSVSKRTGSNRCISFLENPSIMCEIPQLWDFHFHPRLHYGGRFCRQIDTFCILYVYLGYIDVNTLLQQGYFMVGLLDAQWGRSVAARSDSMVESDLAAM
jgi:hypothetical protein